MTERKERVKKKRTVEPKEEIPSPNQPLLDKYVNCIQSHLGKDCLEESYINKQAKHIPTIVVPLEKYYQVAELLKKHKDLDFNYLSELHGTDFETHMEVFVYLFSFKNHQAVILKTKLDQENPKVSSLVPLWEGANWPECEAYDLLGIQFEGHPNLHRIFLGENWKGYPLRKDYKDENDNYM